MILNVKNRIPSINILQIDYEYCIISYYSEEARNDLGEPTHILMERGSNIKCSIDPINQTHTYIRKNGVRNLLRQGIIERNLYIMTLLVDQAIERGDIVSDYDGINYNVLYVANWHSHKEALIGKID